MGRRTQIAHLLTEAVNAGERGTTWVFEAHLIYQGSNSRGWMPTIVSMVTSRLARVPGLGLCGGERVSM